AAPVDSGRGWSRPWPEVGATLAPKRANLGANTDHEVAHGPHRRRPAEPGCAGARPARTRLFLPDPEPGPDTRRSRADAGRARPYAALLDPADTRIRACPASLPTARCARLPARLPARRTLAVACRLGRPRPPLRRGPGGPPARHGGERMSLPLELPPPPW